jgi:excisionase family DNA binding protein
MSEEIGVFHCAIAQRGLAFAPVTETKRLTASEISLEHGIAKRTVLHAITMGWLPAIKFGHQGLWLIEQDDLEEWLARREQLPVYQKR